MILIRCPTATKSDWQGEQPLDALAIQYVTIANQTHHLKLWAGLLPEPHVHDVPHRAPLEDLKMKLEPRVHRRLSDYLILPQTIHPNGSMGVA
jgi:hypothetical protein